MAGDGFTIGDWCWFTRQASPCRVIERQDVWGEVAYRVWLPAKDAVVRARAVDLASLDEPTLVTAAVCPHCQFRPSAEQLELIPAANRLHKLDDDLDQLVANWQQTLLENLEDPFTQDSLGLLPPASKKLIDAFLASRKLPDPMTTEFANAVQEALSGLEKIAVKGDEIKQALLQGGSPATPDDLRKRFDTFMNERCKGKDATKLRFVIE